MYILDKSQNLNYTNTNKEMVIKFRVAQIEETEDFRTYNSEIFFDNKIELKEDEFELGRFKLREGAELRSNYNDFLDFSTKYNTINIINVKYANVEKHTLHPLIIRTFAKKLLKASYDNNLDTIFAMESLNSKTIDRDVIISYLVRRLGIAEKGYTNLELYEYMKKIVKELSGVKLNEERRDKGPKKIIVD
ncbi:DNA and RNA helicase [Selenihalanaerobacter shriftii]|uniref:DNA and RNA helicase n=1 Tax=Selenihalanaerobacter shriftii TaxID=142842 RepID=UPI00117B9F55|nr:DNA and RNA helicase [Selenihalanaerobacter shriftii]